MGQQYTKICVLPKRPQDSNLALHWGAAASGKATELLPAGRHGAAGILSIARAFVIGASSALTWGAVHAF